MVPELQGISHIDLTVSDGEASAAWWQDVMGFTLVNRSRGETFEVRSLIHPTGVAVSVVTHDVPLGGAFDERRVGLDHLGLKVADRDELQRWVTHLDAKGVSHSGIIDIWGYPFNRTSCDQFEVSGFSTDGSLAGAPRSVDVPRRPAEPVASSSASGRR